MRWRLAISVFLGLVGCHGRQSPDDTFRAFTIAVVTRQPDTAWALLSKGSQDAMTEATKQAAAAAPKDRLPDDPKTFLFGDDIELAKPVKDIKLLDQNDKTAHLEVTTEEGTHKVTMVSEDGNWRLDLTEGLKL